MAERVYAIGLPDGSGEGPLAGEVVPMPPGVDIVTTTIEDETSREVREYSYDLHHVAIPPRTGRRYHVLVPTGDISWQQVLIATARTLIDADAPTRNAVACPNTLCELTSLDNVVES